MKRILTITALIFFVGWFWFNKNENETSYSSSNHTIYNQGNRKTVFETQQDRHYDSDYKYEYRTGGSGNYSYNYDISGYGDDGNYYNGNVDMTDKYGDGYIYDDEGNEVYIEVEWYDYGVMEGYDQDGNYYEFEVD